MHDFTSDVYLAYGEVLHAIQEFELALVGLGQVELEELGEHTSAEEAWAAVLPLFGMTAGGLKRRLHLEDDLAERLGRVIPHRNFMVHQSLTYIGFGREKEALREAFEPVSDEAVATSARNSARQFLELRDEIAALSAQRARERGWRGTLPAMDPEELASMLDLEPPAPEV